MDILGIGMFALGALGSFIFGIMILITAFQKHILWGLAYLFLPFASLIFVVMNWDRASKPFLLGLLSGAIAIGGVFVSPTLQESLKEGSKDSANVEIRPSTPDPAKPTAQ